MIGLQQYVGGRCQQMTAYINEAYNEEKYGVLLDRVDLKGVKDATKMTKLLKEGLDQAMTRYKVIRVEAIERYNKKGQEDYEKLKAEAIKKEEKKVIAYMKTKPGIMRRKPEKQQEYIDKKIEKFKAEYPKNHWIKDIDFDEEYAKVTFYYDIHSGHAAREYRNKYYDNEKKAEEIIDYIVSKQEHDEAWKALEGLFITVSYGGLTDWTAKFNVYPDFPEDVQKGLDKEVERFCDFMSGEYGNGRYMGD